MDHKLSFQREKYALWDCAKFNMIQWVFKIFWLFDSPCKHAIFIFTLLGFEIQDFSPFLFFIFYFFGLCFDAWIRVGKNTVSTIPIGLRTFGLKYVSICYINYSRKLPKMFVFPTFWYKKSLISSHWVTIETKRIKKKKNIRLIEIWI